MFRGVDNALQPNWSVIFIELSFPHCHFLIHVGFISLWAIMVALRRCMSPVLILFVHKDRYFKSIIKLEIIQMISLSLCFIFYVCSSKSIQLMQLKGRPMVHASSWIMNSRWHSLLEVPPILLVNLSVWRM